MGSKKKSNNQQATTKNQQVTANNEPQSATYQSINIDSLPIDESIIEPVNQSKHSKKHQDESNNKTMQKSHNESPKSNNDSQKSSDDSQQSSSQSWWRWLVDSVGLLNLLLVFAPPAVILRIMGTSEMWQFAFACLAIIPLAGLLGEATEHLSEHLGSGTGGLLNASFGNAAELIIASFSVFRGIDVLVKASLVGSIIGNLLLVLGASILCGGIRYHSQSFSVNAANIDSNMSVVAAIGFLVPSMFELVTSPSISQSTNPSEEQLLKISEARTHSHQLSLGISCIFLATYIFMLFFQLKTHSQFFNPKSEEQNNQSANQSNDHASENTSLLSPTTRQNNHQLGHRKGSFHIPRSAAKILSRAASMRSVKSGSGTNSGLQSPTHQSNDEYGATVVDVDEESDSDIIHIPGIHIFHSSDDNELPSLKRALFTLSIATLCVVVLSEILTGAVEKTGKELGLNELFVGVIIVAIVGNAAEHFTAVIAAMHNDMDIAISIAFGSALQISMFVMPVVVLLSYVRSDEYGPMDLSLSGFEVFGVTCATLISWMVVTDGASTWLEGLMLLVIYAIMALAFFYAGDVA